MRLSAPKPNVRLRHAPPGEASPSRDIPSVVRKKKQRKRLVHTPGLGTHVMKRCDPNLPASSGRATATAPSHAHTLLNTRSPASMRNTRFDPSAPPLTAGLWKVPVPHERMPTS